MQSPQEQEHWYETFDVDSDDESLDVVQNLGVESPFYQYFGSGQVSRSSVPQSPSMLPGEVTKRRIWRSRSFDRKKRVLGSHSRFARSKTSLQSQSLIQDSDCGICFDVPHSPARTSCCDTVFCYEHISDWLSAFENGTSSCPSCTRPCSLSTDVRQLHDSTGSPKIASLASSISHISFSSVIPRDILSTPLQAQPVTSSASNPYFPSENSLSHYSSDTSESLPTDDTLSEDVKDFSPRTHLTSKPKSVAQQELIARLFTLAGLGLTLCLIFNKQAESIHTVV